LANHGYIPRDGKDIDLKKLAAGMLSGYNIEYSDALLLWWVYELLLTSMHG
jgi:hypothetical protein